MNRMKKLLSLLLVIAMVCSIGAMITGCNNGEESGATEAPTEGSTAPTPTNPKPSNPTTPSQPIPTDFKEYKVFVSTLGGMKLGGISVYIYTDSSMTELQDAGETNAEGYASFALPISNTYHVEIQGLPEGYIVNASYPFVDDVADIKVTSALITDKTLSDANRVLGLGDVMYDFTVMAAGYMNADGERVDSYEIKLSDIMAEKDMVLLNFWYSSCGPCVNEFPYMDKAYLDYQDKAAVIALNPMEDLNTVENFKGSMGLSVDMAACNPGWAAAFNVTGYPTSVIVDRYGVICLIEVGGMPSQTPFVSMFEHFTAENYEQKLCPNGVDDIIVKAKPSEQMPSKEDIDAAVNQNGVNVTYRPEENDEYSFPFIIEQWEGENVLFASNKGYNDSYAIIKMDVELKAGQAFGFDYLVSSELGCDYLHVIVNDEAIYSIAKAEKNPQWNGCYPVVADKDGVYEVALCYIKDSSDSIPGEGAVIPDNYVQPLDVAMIKNLRIVDASEIDADTYLPRQAGTLTDSGFEYVEVVYNPNDGYYHVGSANGPLLLADLMGFTPFHESKTVWDLAYGGEITIGNHNYYVDLEDYFNYASNSSLTGVCTVDKTLAELLKIVASIAGFDGDDNEWLKICKYFEVYGENVEQLQDPIKGLAPFSAYEAKLGLNVETNYFYYDRVIMPRGKYAKFVPTKSGVYRITSRTDNKDGVNGWIFDGDRNVLLEYEWDERMWGDNKNVSMVYYMEAGQAYYIDIAFWDVYEVGYIYYDIEYVAESYELFRLASPGYFTYDTDATGEQIYAIIAGGVDVILGDDGYYYVDLGNGKKGSKLYADFIGFSLFSHPILSNAGLTGMIDMGAFDFSKTEDDMTILNAMKKYNNDFEKVVEYMLSEAMTDFETEEALRAYVQDVFNGDFHGKHGNLTDEIKTYAAKMYDGKHTERIGCVEVDERLAEILQLLMDKYTFENVDHSWTKLCYFYDYLGAGPNGGFDY